MRSGEPMLTIDQTSSLTWAGIDLNAIEQNISTIRKRLPIGCKFMAVVKADGYGHGGVKVAKAAVQAGADELAVSNLEEAVRLRKHGISAPILVLTPPMPAHVDTAVRYDIALPVHHASWLVEMRRYKRAMQPLRVHLKMDTGMGRTGIHQHAEFEAIVPLLAAEDILVEGVYTHFATANAMDSTYYEQQWQRFMEMRKWLRQSGWHGVPAHCANSAAAIRYPERSLDMVRVGAALYGIDTRDRNVRALTSLKLRSALSLHSSVIQVKRVEKGETLGYDQSYTAVGGEWIATVPVGYADGLSIDFRGFQVLVEGMRVPIVGNICMDQFMIRLPHYVPVGTQVTWIGYQREQSISLEEAADYIGTIPQQIATSLSDRIKRVYS